MQIAIISDTHMPRGRRRLPDACVQALRDSDLVLHAGDISTVSALEQIAGIGTPLRAIHGNVDEEALRRSLPVSLELELEGVRIAMLHDAGPRKGRLERLRARFPSAAVVVFGHSHVALCETAPDGFQIFNPGSPTERRRSPLATMGVATLTRGKAALAHLVV